MLSKQMEETLKYYNLGLAAYKQMQWDEAIQAFEKALTVNPEDGPSRLYLKRSKEYKISPPGEGWDGVFTMTTK